MFKYLGFCGYGFVGKDAAFKGLKRLWPHGEVLQIAFADPIKVDLARCLDRLKKHRPELDFSAPDVKTILRDLYESYGTRVARTLYPSIWISEANATRQQYEDFQRVEDGLQVNKSVEPVHLICFTDVRNVNELDWVEKTLGGKVFYVARPGFGPAAPIEEETIGEILAKNPKYTLQQSPKYQDERILSVLLNNRGIVEYEERVFERVFRWVFEENEGSEIGDPDV